MLQSLVPEFGGATPRRGPEVLTDGAQWGWTNKAWFCTTSQAWTSLWQDSQVQVKLDESTPNVTTAKTKTSEHDEEYPVLGFTNTTVQCVFFLRRKMFRFLFVSKEMLGFFLCRIFLGRHFESSDVWLLNSKRAVEELHAALSMLQLSRWLFLI